MTEPKVNVQPKGRLPEKGILARLRTEASFVTVPFSLGGSLVVAVGQNRNKSIPDAKLENGAAPKRADRFSMRQQVEI